MTEIAAGANELCVLEGRARVVHGREPAPWQGAERSSRVNSPHCASQENEEATQSAHRALRREQEIPANKPGLESVTQDAGDGDERLV
mgnify:CR=1 FL=1